MTTSTPSTSRRDTLLGKAPDRFRRAYGSHELTVLHDDGDYRHLQLAPAAPSPEYAPAITLVTWPGGAALVGRFGSHTYTGDGDLLPMFDLGNADADRLAGISIVGLCGTVTFAAYLDHRAALETELAR